MNVYEVNARFMRRAQVREYEPVEAEIAVKAQLAEGENAESIMAELLSKAKNSVYDTLGIKKTAPATGGTVAPVNAVVNKATAPLTVEVDTTAIEKAVEKAVENAVTGEPVKRGRGRPPGSGKKQETTAAAASEIPDETPAKPTEEKAVQVAANGIPDETPAPVAKTAATASDIPDDAPVTAKTETVSGDVTAKDIAAIIHKSLVKKSITTAEVKGLMAKHKVDRLGDIPADVVPKFYADLAAMPGLKDKLEGAKLAE